MSSYQFKGLTVILVLLLVFLQYRLWFESDGILDMMRMKRELAAQTDQNAKLKNRNDRLLRHVQHLQAHSEAIEARARGELGMIKKNETFYQVVK